MPVTQRQAQQLLTKAEFEFASQSWSPAVRAHSPARLRQKVSRARRLRDKYRDEARRQAGEAKGGRAPRGRRAAQGNQNTELKAKIFDQALERFQKRLAELEEAPEKTAATGKEPTSSAKPPSPKKPALGKAKAKAKAKASSGKAATESSKAARKDAKIIQSGVKKTLGHSRGRGRRSQARKDSR